MSKPKIAVIVGSTRAGRFADKPAEWIVKIANSRGDVEVELLDLKDYPMPFFAEATSPAWGVSEDAVARKWQAKLAEFDGFIFTAAEYNHAPTAVLKNALDYAGSQWYRKPAGFIGYGGIGGGRAVEHLRMIAVELQMAPVKAAVHIVWADYLPVAQGQKKLEDLDHLNQAATALLDDVVWWATALRTARQAEAVTAQAA
jgi:NAD(P)H-dependent FMN reductase